MEPFRTLRSIAIPLAVQNVDTDRITPARFGIPTGVDYGQFMLYDLRFDEQGQPLPDSVFNRPAYSGARILVADANFGCGSSRESAVWCLRDYGFRCLVAPSFGDIFAGNCFKQGLLPVVLAAEIVADLRAQLTGAPGAEIEVDLTEQTLRAPSGAIHRFEVDPFRKHCLHEGIDELELTGREEPAIAAFEERQRRERPWVANPPGREG
jgi:3-isopropylmalate/(R)-2-methylmalate dehydratase small subunit